MTIFRCSVVMAMVVSPIAFASAAAPEAQARDECSNIDPSTERRCISARMDRKEQLLNELAVEARSAVDRSFRAYGSSDDRTDPLFFDQSQRGWRKYIEDNCTVEAAYGGGSNSAISDRWVDCMEREFDRRIAFLRDLIDGRGVFAS